MTTVTNPELVGNRIRFLAVAISFSFLEVIEMETQMRDWKLQIKWKQTSKGVWYIEGMTAKCDDFEGLKAAQREVWSIYDAQRKKMREDGEQVM